MKQAYKLLIIIFLLPFFLSNCYSQDDKIFLISLAKEHIELTYFPIKFKEIIDNRYNKVTVGNVQRGMFKKRWPATCELDMKEEVKQLFTNSKLISNKSEDYSFIINSIWINEISYRTLEKVWLI